MLSSFIVFTIYYIKKATLDIVGIRNICRAFPHRVGRVLLFLQRSELGLPQPLARRRVCPPPLWFWRERGGGRVPIPTRRHTLWYHRTLDTYVLCGLSHCCAGGLGGHRPPFPPPPSRYCCSCRLLCHLVCGPTSE